MAGALIEEFRPLLKNTLRGFARVRFPSGLVMHEVAVHVAHGRAWASPPSRPMLDRDGNAMRDAGGKMRWQPLITFASKEIRDNWSAQVLAGVRVAYPDALHDAAPERAA